MCPINVEIPRSQKSDQKIVVHPARQTLPSLCRERKEKFPFHQINNPFLFISLRINNPLSLSFSLIIYRKREREREKVSSPITINHIPQLLKSPALHVVRLPELPPRVINHFRRWFSKVQAHLLVVQRLVPLIVLEFRHPVATLSNIDPPVLHRAPPLQQDLVPQPSDNRRNTVDPIRLVPLRHDSSTIFRQNFRLFAFRPPRGGGGKGGREGGGRTVLGENRPSRSDQMETMPRDFNLDNAIAAAALTALDHSRLPFDRFRFCRLLSRANRRLNSAPSLRTGFL